MLKFQVRIKDRSFEVAVAGEGDRYDVLIDGKSHPVALIFSDASHDVLLHNNTCYDAVLVEEAGAYAVDVRNHVFRVEVHDPRKKGLASSTLGDGGGKTVSAKMPGRVIKLLVAPGTEVAEGQGLLILEAMKMQNEIRAPRAGVVASLPAAEGAAVESGQPLVIFE
jgi:biotin carboxyl carrier protein